MTDVRKETIPVSALALGMFVSELDRPWLDTPFMLQGFLIEEESQLDTLRALCRTVVIDRSLSKGEHYAAPPKEKVAITRSGVLSIEKRGTSEHRHRSQGSRQDFFDVMRNLKESREPDYPISAATETKSATLKDPHDPKFYEPVSSPSFADFGVGLNGLRDKFRQWFSGRSKHTASIAVSDRSKAGLSNRDITTVYEEVVPVEEEIAVVYPVFTKTQSEIRKIFETIAQENKINITHVSETIDGMIESIQRNPDALMWLARLKQTDDYAYNKALSVSINLMAFANFIAIPKTKLKELGLAGLLQDIGKVKIPHALLQKTETLANEEREILHSHVEHSLRLLDQSDEIPMAVREIIAQHHERHDGSGYPQQLRNGSINLYAQMAGLIDTYCAMTTARPYAQGLFNQQAMDKIHGMRDRQFNPDLVDQLIQFLGIYPVSSLVELNTGEVAVVIQQNYVRRLQPRVMVLLSQDKSRNAHPATLDLLYQPLTPDGEPYRIVRGLPPDSFGLNPADFYL